MQVGVFEKANSVLVTINFNQSKFRPLANEPSDLFWRDAASRFLPPKFPVFAKMKILSQAAFGERFYRPNVIYHVESIA